MLCGGGEKGGGVKSSVCACCEFLKYSKHLHIRTNGLRTPG